MTMVRSLMIAAVCSVAALNVNAAGYFNAPAKDYYEGWACNPATPGYSGWIHFWRDDGVFLGALPAANQREEAVQQICGDSGLHGFGGTLPITVEHLDNKWHTVRAYFINSDNTNFELQNSMNVLFDGGPVTPPPPPPPVLPTTVSGCNVASPGAGWVATYHKATTMCSTAAQPFAGFQATYQYVGANSQFVYNSGYELVTCGGPAPAGWQNVRVASTTSCNQNFYGYVDNAIVIRKL